MLAEVGVRFGASAGVTAFGWMRIGVIVLVAYLMSRIVPRVARRVVRRLLDSQMRRRLAVLGAKAPRSLRDTQPVPIARQHQRAEAIGTLVKGVSAATIWAIATALILNELDVALVTVVAGAGFLGVAIAFGAQQLIRDYVAGFFILLDDRYGIGDRVQAGSVEGAVEEVTLRWTRVRDFEGTEWYVPNSRMEEVGNRSLHEGRAVVDIEIPPTLRLSDALERIDDAIGSLHERDHPGGLILEEPDVLGVETFGIGSATVRVAVTTPPHRQAEVARAVRAQILQEFERRDDSAAGDDPADDGERDHGP